MCQHTVLSQNAQPECCQVLDLLAKTTHIQLYANTEFCIKLLSTIRQLAAPHSQKVQVHTFRVGGRELPSKNEK